MSQKSGAFDFNKLKRMLAGGRQIGAAVMTLCEQGAEAVEKIEASVAVFSHDDEASPEDTDDST